jgi:hypothetical protein
VTLFLLGATLGAILDAIHTHFGATVYARPVFFRMAWWVPLLFGAAFTIGLVRPGLERLLGRPSPIPSAGTAIVGMALFVIAYWLSVVPLPWLAVAGLLLAVWFVGWWRCDRTLLGVVIGGCAAAAGPAVEHTLVSHGTFVHLQVQAWGVPGWLPFLYLCASVGLCTLARRLVYG